MLPEGTLMEFVYAGKIFSNQQGNPKKYLLKNLEVNKI